MTNAVAIPLFHVSLGDRDEWVVEVEWPDGTLERVSTFKTFGSGSLDSHDIRIMAEWSRGYTHLRGAGGGTFMTALLLSV